MNRSDVEHIVRSVMRQYSVQSDIRRIDLSSGDWNIEFVDTTGASTTLTVSDSSPQNLRRFVLTALDLEE